MVDLHLNLKVALEWRLSWNQRTVHPRTDARLWGTWLRCFVASLLRCFVASLLRCFVASLLRRFVASLLRCFVASLLRCFVAFFPSFLTSFVRPCVRSCVRSCVLFCLRSFVASFVASGHRVKSAATNARERESALTQPFSLRDSWLCTLSIDLIPCSVPCFGRCADRPWHRTFLLA